MSSNQLEQQHLSSSIASPQVQFKIESDSTDKCMGEELMDAAVSAAVAHAAESIYLYLPGKLAGSKSRQAHTLKDPDGTEKIFNSALGFLARKFIHVLFVSAFKIDYEWSYRLLFSMCFFYSKRHLQLAQLI
jgi:hypothetical protein